MIHDLHKPFTGKPIKLFDYFDKLEMKNAWLLQNDVVIKDC